MLTSDDTIGTALERIEYDQVHGVNPRFIDHIGAEWTELIGRLGVRSEDVLDVGAGTGVLTLGLLEHQTVGRLVATDVSFEFLHALAPRVAAFETPVSLVACDANQPNFRAGSFDLIVGRSILHHLLDYDETLSRSHAMLKPGGVAVFFEPVLEGKTIVAMLLALMLRCDATADHPVLSPRDREGIEKQLRHQTKSKRRNYSRAALAQVEDKYIFEIDHLKAVGKEAGFDEVEFLNNADAEPTYWPSVVQTCVTVGVAPETIRPYRWIGQQFAETYGLMAPDKLVTPMGYFVFRKAHRSKRRPRLPVTAGEPRDRAVPARSRSRLATAIVIGLTRVGLSVRDARELHTTDEHGVHRRNLVFVVSLAGIRYLVAPKQSGWPRSLRTVQAGELRVGRRVEPIHATEIRDHTKVAVVRSWYRRLASLRLVDTDTAPSYAQLARTRPEHRVFRIDPAQSGATKTAPTRPTAGPSDGSDADTTVDG
ncbi:MAG TPA: class I SAM-dependent methyltransferase [Acidimicrobiia bacterium]|nr:class I SAM-dependent methyltransferase [Acidimicrobiia bacterium]